MIETERKANPFVRFIKGVRIGLAIQSGDSLKASKTAEKLGRAATEQWMYAIEANAVAEVKGKRKLMPKNLEVIAELGRKIPNRYR